MLGQTQLTLHHAFSKRKALPSTRTQGAEHIQRACISSKQYAGYEFSNGTYETVRGLTHCTVCTFDIARRTFLEFAYRFMAASAIADEEPEVSGQGGETASQTADNTLS
jgi:hypothetical protein